MAAPQVDPLSFVREDLRTFDKYVGVRPLDIIADEIGVDLNEIVKLDANENLYGPPPQVIDAIRQSYLHIYPDPSQTFLRRELAEYIGHGIDENWVVGGSGSDDMIDIIMRFTRPGAVVISTPTFGMYTYLAKISKLPVVDVPRLAFPSFALDMPQLVKTIREQKASIVFVVSPNNPTGTLVPNSEIETLCQEDVLVVVDEAYAEFSRISAAELLHKFPNLIILRTFSKWAGLAGLRVGFAVAHPTLVNVMLSTKQPYNINVAAEAGARTALALRNVIAKDIDAIVAEREVLMKELSKFSWIQPVPSTSNFILCRIQNGPLNARDLAASLRKLGVLIRYFDKAPIQDFIRISATRPQDTRALLHALTLVSTSKLITPAVTKALPLEAIIFDMDGVLADESISYRTAIIQTAAAFGVMINTEFVSQFKASGGANNDWVCTQQILAKHNKTVALEEVTARFESFYQGTDQQIGLWMSETLIPTRSLIKFLASIVPLAIVTGRPRADAARFLKQHDIAEFFNPVICMEDGPSKPDPAPVNLALQRLNKSSPEQRARVVMIGDTPNDALAASRAGIVPLGVLAPCERGSQAMTASLTSAGTVAILQDLQELRLLVSRLAK